MFIKTMSTESIFSNTMANAISVYRQILKKHFSQSERVRKVAELSLKNQEVYNSDVSLYQLGHKILRDIEDNIQIPHQGYYSYSGIKEFYKYLKDYLANYDLESDYNGNGAIVIHKAQKASRAMIEVIQFATLPENRLNQNVAKKIQQCNQIISEFGSEDQKVLYKDVLLKAKEIDPPFYSPLIDEFIRLSE